MADQDMTPEQLDQLLEERTREGQYLEYKHGNQLQDHNAGQVIRQYVSGFANSDGGLLLVGVDETNWTVTGAKARDGRDLGQWASDTLVGMAGYFSPPPRFKTIPHARGNLLLVATHRSAQLVPCPEGSRLRYYFRFDDKTLPAPDYLLADLVLGRRQGPQVDMTDAWFTDLSAEEMVLRGVPWRMMTFGLRFGVENVGLRLAEDVRLGLTVFDGHGRADAPINRFLASHLDISRNEKSLLASKLSLSHIESALISNPFYPFHVSDISASRALLLPLRILDKGYAYTWKAAAYLMAEGAPPTWYQVTLRVDSELHRLLGTPQTGPRQINDNKQDWLTVRRLPVERPEVTWEDAPT